MPIPNAGFVTLYWSIGGTLAVNVLGVQAGAGSIFSQASADTIGAGIKSSWTATLGALMHTSTSLVRVGIRDMRQDNLPEFRDQGAPVTGTGVGDLLPPSNAVCVTIRTALSGKSFRGRMYVSGWTEAENTAAGVQATTAQTGAVNFFNGIAGVVGPQNMSLGVVSRPSERYTIVKTTFHADGTTTTKTLSNVAARAGGATVGVSAESRSALWETQRRRVNGRGASPTTLVPIVKVSLPPT